MHYVLFMLLVTFDYWTLYIYVVKNGEIIKTDQNIQKHCLQAAKSSLSKQIKVKQNSPHPSLSFLGVKGDDEEMPSKLHTKHKET